MGVVSDPIADMLTRIRNAIMVGHSKVVMPSSKIKQNIANILVEEGFVHSFGEEQTDLVQNQISVSLKYFGRGDSAIKGLKRVSKPGRRVYAGSSDIPRIRNGLGIAILSTSKGLMTDKQARSENLGGEVLCYVW